MSLFFQALAAFFIFTNSAQANYPESFQLQGTPDLVHSVSKYTSAAVGGSLETTDADGNVYKLQIPKNALLLDTYVSITPLKIAGLHGETAHIGVDLSPAGTHLFDFATLEIIPVSKNFKNSYWLETTGTAQNILARPGFSAMSGFSMLISHFSGGSLVTGGDQVSSSLQNGVFDGTQSWFDWQRNVIKQDFDSGRIDQITYDAKFQIIIEHAKSINAEIINDLVKKTTAAADDAVERARQHSKDGDPKNYQAFMDDFERALVSIRQNEMLGHHDPKYTELIHMMNIYVKAIYDNCENTPLGEKLFYTMERRRQLLGAEDFDFSAELCINGSKFYHVVAQYIFKSKTASHPDRFIDNVNKRFEFSLRIAYQSPNPKIETEILGSVDFDNSYENHYESHPYFGEGCKGTQEPIGKYEIFQFQNKIEAQGFYNPGTVLPPGVQLPPGFPVMPPSASVQIQIYGKSSKLGWKFTTDSPTCTQQDIAPKTQDTQMMIVFDPTQIEKVGQKIIDNHRSEDENEISGWVYTIDRVN